jgi:hypothetical protein
MRLLPPNKMSWSDRSRALGLTITLALIAGSASAQTTTNKVDTNAVNALRRMGTYLRALKQFEIDASATRDEVTANKEKVQVAGTVQYLVRVPNMLRADIRTDRKQRQIFYDGKSLTVFAPRMHFYATVPAPPTIRETLDSASQRLGIEFPLVDLFLWGTPDDGVKELTSARYIGPAYVDGILTDQYAFREKGADWQLWIQSGNTPVPKRLVITTTSNPALPQYAATLKWTLTSTFNDSEFSFVPPRGTERITFTSDYGRTEAPSAPAGRSRGEP